MNGPWVKIALALSLALNLFIIGMVAGAAFQSRRVVEMRAAPVPGNPLMRAGDSLPPAERQAYRARLRQVSLANRPLLDTNRQARDKVADAFSAPSFDEAAATSALAASRDAETAARAQLENAVVDFAKGLNAQDRKALAEGLRQPPQGRGFGGRGGRGPRGGVGGRRGGFGGPPPDAPPPPPQR